MGHVAQSVSTDFHNGGSTVLLDIKVEDQEMARVGSGILSFI